LKKTEGSLSFITPLNHAEGTIKRERKDATWRGVKTLLNRRRTDITRSLQGLHPLLTLCFTQQAEDEGSSKNRLSFTLLWETWRPFS